VSSSLAVAVALVACACGHEPEQRHGPSSADLSPSLYHKIVLDAGASLNPEGQLTVLGIRGRSRDGTLHEIAAEPVYDDTFVLLPADGSAIELDGTTHPWQAMHEDATDADLDEVPDVGLLRPGEYKAAVRASSKDIAGQLTYHVRTLEDSGMVPGWRDTDHDGVWSQRERLASEERGDTLTAILFHSGGDGAPAAIGCQVMAAEDHARLIAQLDGADSFNYVLVDAIAVRSAL
jgi:hypothetical protein